MSEPEPPPVAPSRRRPKLFQALGLVVLVAVVQVLLVAMFGWSASRSAPRGLPLVLAGPSGATGQIAAGFDRSAPGFFRISYLADDVSAQAAVLDRQAYAALSLGGAAPVLYTAPAASPAVASLITQTVTGAMAQAMPGSPLQVRALVGTPPNDPNGAGIPISLIPITITSILAGAILGIRFRLRRRRIAGLLAYALLAGGATALELQNGLGILTGQWLQNAAVVALTCLAVAAAVAGLGSLIGPVGVGLGVLVIFFFGFAFSGATSAWELIPSPWGHLAQFLPVGALNTTLRSVAFFGGQGAHQGWIVLGSWAGAGLLLALLRGGPARNARHAPAA